MNVATPLPDHTTADRLERVCFGLLAAVVALLQVSIAAAHTVLAVALVCWLALLWRDRTPPAAPAFFLPLLAYAAVSLVAVAFSIDPMGSLIAEKKLVLLAIVPMVYRLASRARAETLVTIVITVGAASAAYGIIQYGLLQYDHLGQRPRGALSHYMTYSGLLMLVLCAILGRLVFAARDRAWAALVLPAVVVALTLTFTRSAWVGACAAVGLVFVLRDFRLIAVLPVVVALLFAVAPDRITDRMLSMFDLQDPTNRDRVAMMRAGWDMIAADPLTGVGPSMVPRAYPDYRHPEAVELVVPHLHNVPLQIAVERGLPALAVWIWFLVVLVTGLIRLVRAGPDRVLPATGLTAAAALLVAGLFEHNFGDSEVLMLFLVLVTLPFAATRLSRGPSAT